MPMTAARTPCANRVGAQRRPHRHFLQILDSRRQRARAQGQRQVLRLLLGEAAGDATLIVNLLLNGRDRFHLVVEHHGQLVADVRAGERCEAPSALAGQAEIHVRPAVLIGAGVGGAQIAAAHGRGAADQPVHVAFARLSSCP